MSCARFLKCTIIPLVLHPLVPGVGRGTHLSRKKDACTIHSFALEKRRFAWRTFHLIASGVIFITLLLVIVIQYVLLRLLLPGANRYLVDRHEETRRTSESHSTRSSIQFPSDDEQEEVRAFTRPSIRHCNAQCCSLRVTQDLQGSSSISSPVVISCYCYYYYTDPGKFGL